MKFIPNGVTSKVAMAVLKAKKNSPTVMFVGGVAGIVTTVVLASRATLKLEEVLDEAKKTSELIDTVLTQDAYTTEDRVKDKALLMVKTGIQIGKLYFPAVVLGGLSIAALTGSHVVLSRRNVALTAAYATLEKGFKEYRARVVEDLGEERDKVYARDIRVHKVTETDENGKRTIAEKKMQSSVSPYGKLFREGNPNWNNVPEYNYLFLRGIQNQCNDMLQARGHLLLNDVYDELGFERTKAGMVVGWLVNGKGDGYVDFGIFDDKDALRIHDFITGREGELYLDFNVDGNIYDKF